jgi:hypothetical protein
MGPGVFGITVDHEEVSTARKQCLMPNRGPGCTAAHTPWPGIAPDHPHRRMNSLRVPKKTSGFSKYTTWPASRIACQCAFLKIVQVFLLNAWKDHLILCPCHQLNGLV